MMSAAVNSMIGAQLGSIGRGAGFTESGSESDTLESWALRGTRLVSGSITIEVAVSGVASNRPSLASVVGSELMVGVNT